MNTRLLCIDSDIFAILAVAKRLDRAAELLGFLPASLRRLPALEHMLARQSSFAQFDQVQKSTILSAAQKIPPFTDSPTSKSVHQKLSTTPGIDPGEATIFAVMTEQPILWVASGDSRCMKSLCANANLADVRNAVASRTICLEAVIYLLIQADGYPETAAALSCVRGHRTVRCLFPDNVSCKPDLPLEGVSSYLRSLCSELGRGFLHCPPCPNSHQGTCTI